MKTRPLHIKRAARLTFVALTLGFLVGCGAAPTAPVVDHPASPARAAVTAQTDGLLGTLVSTVGSTVGGVVNLLVRTLKIVGGIGGTLTNGRWRVTVPDGAVTGDATVSLGVVNQGSLTCQLEIAPASLNHFDTTPVTLTVDCSGVQPNQLRDYTIFWLDPSTNQWVPVAGSTVNLTNRTVSAPLKHFSTYRVGPKDSKASW